jgi:hypothetical protein
MQWRFASLQMRTALLPPHLIARAVGGLPAGPPTARLLLACSVGAPNPLSRCIPLLLLLCQLVQRVLRVELRLLALPVLTGAPACLTKLFLRSCLLLLSSIVSLPPLPLLRSQLLLRGRRRRGARGGHARCRGVAGAAQRAGCGPPRGAAGFSGSSSECKGGRRLQLMPGHRSLPACPPLPAAAGPRGSWRQQNFYIRRMPQLWVLLAAATRHLVLLVL